ncbi:MAG TPA: type IV toxin-antitoxin system AbiEi family antitoxin [Mucilaginibacter sp.]|jgi:predicted transcriptional regulator of viral defense system|nr:type IV toxin-antitoxin system AbiEi family antitoxin [Mucilaginibacter sp.]
MKTVNEISISEWVEKLLSKGRNSFSLTEVRESFEADSEAATKLKLTRLSKKGKIISIYKGYYLIISAQYASRGVLPPSLFIDGLMKYLDRPYYVGLLNAAAFYGAAHQQPQEFFVFTELPAPRPTKRKGLKINYIGKNISQVLLEKRKTETGYISVSSPELTAADLVQFEKRIGGLNRAATVLNELAEVIKPEQLNETFLKEIPVATIQRLGFLLDKQLNKKLLADYLFEQCRKEDLSFFRIPLRTAHQTKGFSSDDKWKVIVNTEIEIDE